MPNPHNGFWRLEKRFGMAVVFLSLPLRRERKISYKRSKAFWLLLRDKSDKENLPGF